MKFKWDKIEETTEIAKVFGGWVIRSRDVDDCNTEYTVESMVFVPDPTHQWKVDKQ